MTFFVQDVFDLLALADSNRSQGTASLTFFPSSCSYLFIPSPHPIPYITRDFHPSSSTPNTRVPAMTNMNEHSSRSHMMLTVTVISENKVTGVVTRGKLNLVDLAGSERLNKSGTHPVSHPYVISDHVMSCRVMSCHVMSSLYHIILTSNYSSIIQSTEAFPNERITYLHFPNVLLCSAM